MHAPLLWSCNEQPEVVYTLYKLDFVCVCVYIAVVLFKMHSLSSDILQCLTFTAQPSKFSCMLYCGVEAGQEWCMKWDLHIITVSKMTEWQKSSQQTPKTEHTHTHLLTMSGLKLITYKLFIHYFKWTSGLCIIMCIFINLMPSS